MKISAIEAATRALRSDVLPTLQPGEQLPSEAQLVEQLAFSRATIREALARLASQGVVVRRWGVGTFLVDVPPRVARGMTSISGGLAAILASSGGEPSIARFAYEESAPDPELLPDFPDVPTYVLARVFALDGVPVIHLTDVIPQRIGARSLDPRPLASIDAHMHEVLAMAGSRFVELEVQAWADIADGALIDELGMSETEPVLRTEGAGKDDLGRTVVATRAAYRTRMVRIVLTAD